MAKYFVARELAVTLVLMQQQLSLSQPVALRHYKCKCNNWEREERLL